MDAATRDQWISRLEAVARANPDTVSSEWSWILQHLKLPLEFFPYVLEAIQQGRWKTARNPKSYIRRVAWLESVKAELEFEDSNPLKLVTLPADGSLSMENALEHFVISPTLLKRSRTPMEFGGGAGYLVTKPMTMSTRR